MLDELKEKIKLNPKRLAWYRLLIKGILSIAKLHLQKTGIENPYIA